MLAREPTIAAIKRAVAAEYKVALDSMDEPDGSQGSRLFERSHPRQLAMALSLAMTRHSINRVGIFFRRDHSTVLNARRAVNRRVLSDPETRRHARNVLKALRRRAT